MPEIRAYRAGDEDGIRRLFEICHRRPLEPDVWKWRYRSGPLGPAVIDVAVDGSEIVGHVGSLPTALDRGTDSLRAGLWVDLMIDPRHRNLTLFLDLAEANRRRCAVAGIEALFAFPNDKSFPVLKRMLGWIDGGDILALEGPLASLRRPSSSAPAAEPVADFGAEFDEFWTRVRPSDRLTGERGAARLRWRYRGRPRARYPVWASRGASGRMNGWIAAKTFAAPGGAIGDVLDFWFEPGSPAADALLNAAFDFFKSENVATVSAWALDGTHQRAALEARGLAPGKDRTHLAGRWTAETGPDFPSRHADWSLFKGDSDVF